MTFTSKFHANTLHARSAGEAGSCRSRGLWFDASAFDGALPAPLWAQRSGSQATRQMKIRLCSEARLPGRSARNLELAVSAWRDAARSCVERSEETRQHMRCSEVTRHHVRVSEGARVLKRQSVRRAAAQAVDAPNIALQRTAGERHGLCSASLRHSPRHSPAVAELGALGASEPQAQSR